MSTQFLHLMFIPLIPLWSKFVLDSGDGGRDEKASTWAAWPRLDSVSMAGMSGGPTGPRAACAILTRLGVGPTLGRDERNPALQARTSGGSVGLRASIANVARIEQVVTVFMLHGLQLPLARMRLTRCATWRCRAHCTMQRWMGRTPPDTEWPRAVRDALVELGPAFVKLGQILSVRGDFVPAALVEELHSLQSAVPPFPYAEVRARVEEETGAPLEQMFRRFSQTPLAAASIAQVHEAELLDGTRVAVKIKRPGIDEVVRRDMDVLVWLAEQAERRWSLAGRYRPKASAEELRQYTLRELDFRREAKVAIRLATHYAERPGVRVPKVYSSTTGMLVMEFIDGVQIDDIEAMEAQGVDRKELVRVALEAMLAQILEFGLFHGDPHPGNLHVTPSGELIFLDFGIFGELDEHMRRQISLLMLSLVRGDVDLATNYLLRMATLTPQADPDAFREAIGARYRAWKGSTVSEFGFAELLYDELSLGVKYGVIFPPDMVLFGKAMLTIEGVIMGIDPDLDLSKEAGPYMEKVRTKLFGWRRLSDALESSLPLWWELAERLPATLPLALDLALQPPARDKPQPTVISRRAPLGEIVTIGAGLALLLAQIGPSWEGVSALGLTVLCVGVTWGVISYWRE